MLQVYFPLPLPILLSASAAAIVAWTACISIYNIYLHPLSKFPGPRLAAATIWWKAYIELYKKQGLVDKLTELHALYGDIVRIGPNELHFAKPEAYHELYSVNNPWDKDHMLYDALSLDGRSSFTTLKYQEAKRRRDVIMPLFSRRSMLDMQHLIRDNVDILCSTVKERHGKGQPWDVYLAMRALTIDTITSFCFAKPQNALYSPGFDAPLAKAMTMTLPMGNIFKHFPLVRWALNRLPKALVLAVKPGLAGFYHFVETTTKQVHEVMRDPKALANAPHPIIYHELLSEQNRIKLTARQLIDEATLLVFAGTDTASNTLTLGTVHVVHNRDIYAKLKQELLEIWPTLEDRPTYEELEKLPYLRAIIKESLRLSGGTITPMTRVVPAEGAVICENFIPGGAVVGMSNVFVHQSDRVFPEPHVFRPERWLDPDTPLDNWLVAFHKGRRSCVGINLAYCELYLAFANLFRRFDMALDSVTPSDMVWKEYYLPHYEGKNLRIISTPVLL
ncbi:hypothetical protein PHLCEN_2v12486 [Hermanssonia centrifuga]|uniref:Cytochrome P450 n=1 Tax=Hermanssonia centrifuga TaxID=98765 RepID=A0A2R6NH26_9APHY|nr:hypothetical protein PHLCEN_2v12486 [Hermanssonia centrifuga]